MVKRNPNIAKLHSSYLFPQIHQRKKEFLAKNPHAQLISLGIGDTTEPITPHVTTSLIKGAESLGTRKGYTGYGPEQGLEELRHKIATVLYNGRIEADEVFVSDGAKCDLGRLQLLFGGQASIAIQDPAFPVYIDGSTMQGVTHMTFLPCLPENQFFPDLQAAQGVDLIYFCSPNNPTGATATREQLASLIAFAKKNGSIIIYDAAYAAYIRAPHLPRSIYEIEGAHEVALEINSFSKIAGFTGVRLGWTIVPNALRYEDGTPIKKDWTRIMTTIFNGASNIAQQGGLGVLDPLGQQETAQLVNFYMENALLLRTVLQEKGYEVFGGDNAPYLWIRFRERSSWDVFQEFLERLHLVTTPGSGFGPSGEGFVRMTAFGHRENILQAIERLRNNKK